MLVGAGQVAAFSCLRALAQLNHGHRYHSRGRAGQDVHQVVVGRCHDHPGCAQRVCDTNDQGCSAPRPLVGQPPDDQRAPDGPGQVHGRHGRQLVGVRDKGVVPRTQAAHFFHYVGETGQHPRRSYGEQPENGEANEVGQHQFVA